MTKNKINNIDKLGSLIFILLTILFICLLFFNKSFLNWTFERHHNILSWYIRPLFLIPFCYFSYKRKLMGIFMTIFFLLTSMFWFPKPTNVSTQINEFLNLEQKFLLNSPFYTKLIGIFIVFISLWGLSKALWKRNLKLGIAVLVLIAISKMFGSVIFAGEVGKSIFIPAIIGLVVCILGIYILFYTSKKND